MEPLEIFLIVIASVLCGVVAIILVMIAYAYVTGDRLQECDGKPYDTVDSEEWYAKCGRVAPHEPHKFKEYDCESARRYPRYNAKDQSTGSNNQIS
jgi:hypothetical protein